MKICETAEQAYQNMGIDPALWNMGEEILSHLKDRFEKIDETCEINQLKVLAAMQKNRISAEHFNGSTGYGYNDAGRDDRGGI